MRNSYVRIDWIDRGKTDDFGRNKEVRLNLSGYTQSVGSDETAGQDFRS